MMISAWPNVKNLRAIAAIRVSISLTYHNLIPNNFYNITISVSTRIQSKYKHVYNYQFLINILTAKC